MRRDLLRGLGLWRARAGWLALGAAAAAGSALLGLALLLLAGQGKVAPQEVRGILASRERARAGANVAAYGLYFTGAEYGVRRVDSRPPSDPQPDRFTLCAQPSAILPRDVRA